MIKVEINCDYCKKDLAKTNNCIDYRIAVTSEMIQNKSGAANTLMVYPPLNSDMHFCSVMCLVLLFRENYPNLMKQVE